jgi:hypothetical protein
VVFLEFFDFLPIGIIFMGMKITEFTKSCPNCGCKQYYATAKGLKVAIKRNRICKMCSNMGEKNPNYGKPCPQHVREIVRRFRTGRMDSEETRQKKHDNVVGEKNPMFGLTGSLCPNFGVKRTEEHKQILHDLKWAVPLSQEHRENIGKGLMGRKHSSETRRKQRVSKIRYIIQQNGSIAPRYNKSACEYFDKLEKERRWSGLYASKNGEFYVKFLGYFVDYYEPVLNIVVEYDEPIHYNIDNSLKKRDHARMMEIVEHLHCKFYRYNQRTGELRQYA